MQAWEEFVDKQEKVLGKETVSLWLRSFKLVTFDSCNLYLDARDSFHLNWFEEHIRPKLSKFYNNNHRLIKVHVRLQEKPKLEIENPIDKFFLSSDPLDPTATFSQFISSEENKIPYTVLQEEVEKTIHSFNPIFLYGEKGSGKTHLLVATANRLIEKKCNVIFVSAEKFTKHVVQAIRKGFMQQFREKYRKADCLIVDDIDLLANRSATQEEFFHTFNTLHTAGKLIILSGNKAPLHLEGIEPRLISRFEWGIELKIDKLKKEHIKSLLEKKCNLLNLSFDHETKEYLAQCFYEDLNMLKEALDAIALRSHISKEEHLSLDTVKNLIPDLVKIASNKKLTPEELFEILSEYFSISTEDLLGKKQTKMIATPRQIAIFLLRMRWELPYSHIGKIFSRDHSTIISSIKKIEKLLEEKDQQITKNLYDLKALLDKSSKTP